MRFYYGSGSPFAWRVQLALEEKGLPYEPVLLSFQAGDLKKPEYLRLNPHGKVPTLTDGDLVIYESQAILEYLEERYPKPALLPADAGARARLRVEELECVNYLAETFLGVARQAFFTPPDQRDEKALADARAGVALQLDKLEDRCKARGGQFVMGTALTRADTTWLPFVEISGRGGVVLDAKRTPWLVAWRDRMRARPSYERSYPPHWRK